MEIIKGSGLFAFPAKIPAVLLPDSVTRSMASAPPLETSGLMGDLQPPSYEEAMGSTSPQYPPDPVNPPTAVRKPAQAPYPVQTYPVQTYPVQTYPLPPPSTPVVSVQTVYVQHGVAYGDRPVQVTCPVCSQMVVTHLEYNAGTMTWLTCAGLFIFG
ncbi:lipopolysaccharide-induced tumor necrosis factor-alpha factor [Arapaima gigas]